MKLVRRTSAPATTEAISDERMLLISIPKPCDEECVIDERSRLRTTEVIQMKLLRLLPSSPVPVSCLHARRDVRR